MQKRTKNRRKQHRKEKKKEQAEKEEAEKEATREIKICCTFYVVCCCYIAVVVEGDHIVTFYCVRVVFTCSFMFKMVYAFRSATSAI